MSYPLARLVAFDYKHRYSSWLELTKVMAGVYHNVGCMGEESIGLEPSSATPIFLDILVRNRAESSADKKDGSLMDIMELLQGDSSLPTAWSTDADTLMDDRRLGIHARPAYTAGIPTRGQYNSVRY
ncbi:hypothetical protein Peur_043781 [Populus x canadensis]